MYSCNFNLFHLDGLCPCGGNNDIKKLKHVLMNMKMLI